MIVIKLLLLHQIASLTCSSAVAQAEIAHPLSSSLDAILNAKALSEEYELPPLQTQQHRHQHLPSRRSESDDTEGDFLDQDDAGKSLKTAREERSPALELQSGSSLNLEQYRGGNGGGSRDRLWHNNRFHHRHTDWCLKDCEFANNNNNSSHHHANVRHSICASDGRLYKSMCELKRHSCRHNVHLRRKPRAFCSASQEDPATAIAAISSSGGSSSSSSTSSKSVNSPTRDRVRIVELKKLCDAEEYTRMKRLMFNEFNGNLWSMFRYYDTDADNYIEAHELWPSEQVAGGGKLIYAQVWDNHTAECPQNTNDDSHGDHSKCWYFLDFAFQPQYPKNPCSLSHLMLFDLRHPNHRFDFEAFARAFSNFTSASINIQSPTMNRITRKTSRVAIELGDNIDLKCGNTEQISYIDDRRNNVIRDNVNNDARCTWTRYNSNLAAARDSHISISEQWVKKGRERVERATGNSREILLHIREAQLYLSGYYKCICHFQELSLDFEHTYHLQVLAEPRVRILPRYQWSLPKSRVSFECQYDQINTNSAEEVKTASETSQQDKSSGSRDKQRGISLLSNVSDALGDQGEHRSQFGLQVEWKRGDEILSQHNQPPARRSRRSDPLVDELLEFSTGDPSLMIDDLVTDNERCNSSSSISITKAISRLTLENIQPCDSNQYSCRVELPKRSDLNPSKSIVGQDNGRLLVQDKPLDENRQPEANSEREVSALWILHENGISIYKIQDDDGQEMELLREISGHSSISANVEGNWNQLTLCGGINSEQAVICEWSDNAVLIGNVDQHQHSRNKSDRQRRRKYVYVGQPNLNRVVVFDSFKFEIVAIINTEPQPRRLHSYEPNKIHLSKWVKRRLSPIANARWKTAIGTRAHRPESTPQESRLYSQPKLSARLVGGPIQTIDDTTTNSNVNETILAASAAAERGPAKRATAEPPLIQHDIWLLCYGQPLAGSESSNSNNNKNNNHHHRRRKADQLPGSGVTQNADSSASSLSRLNGSSETDPIKPFGPRLSTGVSGVVFPPFAWPSNIWPSPSTSLSSSSNGAVDDSNKEARLRNRKSVHIIQSTFLPLPSHLINDGSVHKHSRSSGRQDNFTAIDEFKATSVISTHHIYPGSSTSHFHHINGNPSPLSPLQRISFLSAGRRHRHYDLIQDLHVPQKPYSMERNPEFKIHHAYVTHYDERRLFRVAMDNYRYDREIDLQDCDPIHTLTTAQGLIVVQCRAPISHSLIGQLVLDQLTSSRIEFNANIRAHDSYLSPDNRYLVSIFHNTMTSASSTSSSSSESTNKGSGESFNLEYHSSKNSDTSTNSSSSSAASGDEKFQPSDGQRHSSIVYVQTVTVDGLRLQYEIKTLFEISQCSFVWKDGYYAAIFVTTNRKDQQSEILSLRLIDSRLELIARVPGLVSATRHKEQLIVSNELRLAALTTDQGTFVIDLEENRVSQSLRRHLSPPTLLWV